MNKFIIKKEFRESLYESKGLWMIVAAAFILTSLCVLVVNIKEGSSLAQNDILQYAIKAVLFITLTVSMVLGSATFISEREANTMESLLLTPVSKITLTMAKYCGVLVIGALLLVISIPYLIAIGTGSGLTLNALILTFFTGVILLCAFVAISIILSILLKSSKSSVLVSVLFMIILTFPAFVQGLFKLSAIGLLCLKIDPVVCAFNMMSSMLIDNVSFFTLGQYIIPLVIFVVLSVGLLALASKKVALKGEK